MFVFRLSARAKVERKTHDGKSASLHCRVSPVHEDCVYSTEVQEMIEGVFFVIFRHSFIHKQPIFMSF